MLNEWEVNPCGKSVSVHFFLAAGIMAWPLLVLTIVILGLILRAVSRAREGTENLLFAILFWGFTAAVLGFLANAPDSTTR